MKYRMLFSWCLFFLTFLIAIPSFSQEVISEATVDSASMVIGDHRSLTIKISASQNQKIIFPFLADTIGKFEVVKKGKFDTIVNSDKTVQYVQKASITCFDSGTYQLPAIKIKFQNKEDTVSKFSYTNQLQIKVLGIAVDTTKEIRDIKPPLKVEISLLDYLKENAGYIIGGVLLGALLAYYFYRISKKDKKSVNDIQKPIRPAHESALENLERLEKEKFWQKGEFKTFHSQLSDIIREYIENRFDVNALELTSDETLTSLSNLTHDQRESLKQILVLADLVKFAKVIPIASENEISLKNAYNFIHATRIDQALNRKEAGQV